MIINKQFSWKCIRRFEGVWKRKWSYLALFVFLALLIGCPVVWLVVFG